MLFYSAQAFGSLSEDFTAKGIALSDTYTNELACKSFKKYIELTSLDELAGSVKNAKFVSVMSDSSTDSSITEQEIVYIRYTENRMPPSRFVAVKAPCSPYAVGIYNAVLSNHQELGLGKEEIGRKLVGFGCDGASVLVGKKGGVSGHLRKLQPSLVTIHCLAHCLELCFKDSIKKDSLYDSCITLLKWDFIICITTAPSRGYI